MKRFDLKKRIKAKTNPNPYNVQINQVWKDTSKKGISRNRLIAVVDIDLETATAICQTLGSTRESEIFLHRFTPGATGYELVGTSLPVPKE